ncbi:hypothetical protein GCK32_009844, partial [Trichostrongylus colubriformis]
VGSEQEEFILPKSPAQANLARYISKKKAIQSMLPPSSRSDKLQKPPEPQGSGRGDSYREKSRDIDRVDPAGTQPPSHRSSREKRDNIIHSRPRASSVTNSSRRDRSRSRSGKSGGSKGLCSCCRGRSNKRTAGSRNSEKSTKSKKSAKSGKSPKSGKSGKSAKSGKSGKPMRSGKSAKSGKSGKSRKAGKSGKSGLSCKCGKTNKSKRSSATSQASEKSLNDRSKQTQIRSRRSQRISKSSKSE